MSKVQDNSALTKVIWIYWHQGIHNAPELVKKCIYSWQFWQPTYKIHILDKNSVKEYIRIEGLIPKSRIDKMTLASRSDVLRIHLLDKYGGIWVDATVMCLKPLEEWIQPYLSSSGFFAFHQPGPDRMVSSWFLVSKSGGHITKQWASEVRDFWSGWKFRRKYYWFHYLFNALYESDREVRKEWDATRKFSADGPHFFVPFRKRFFDLASTENIGSFKELDLPVVKLTYKCIIDGYPKGSMIDFILNQHGTS